MTKERQLLHDRYGALLGKVTAWAAANENIDGVMIVGSQTRSHLPADAWSDLDVLIAAQNREPLFARDDWLHAFGALKLLFNEATMVPGITERRALYDDGGVGLDVDFTIFPTEALPLAAPAAGAVLKRGYRIVVDKLGALETFAASAGELPSEPLDEGTWHNALADTLYHVVWAAKKLRRGERFVAKQSTDGYLKRELLKRLEWQAAGNGTPLWHDGRFLALWADAPTVNGLPSAFALYEDASIAQALRATLDLYTRLARAVAGQHGFTYPDESEEFSRLALGRCLAPWDGAST